MLVSKITGARYTSAETGFDPFSGFWWAGRSRRKAQRIRAEKRSAERITRRTLRMEVRSLKE